MIENATTDIEPTNYAVDDAMAELAEMMADAQRAQRSGEYDDPNGYLPQWFLGKLADLDTAEAIVKAQYKVILAQIASRRSQLWYNFGADFQAQVQKDLLAQKAIHPTKKSVSYLTGNAGYRTTGGKPSVVITDASAASLFYDKNYPEAVTYTISKTAALKYYKDTGEIAPGVEIVTPPKVESFSPKPPDRDKLDAEMAALLPQEGKTDE